MHIRLIRIFYVLVLLLGGLLISQVVLASDMSREGYWQGNLQYRSDIWPVQLNVETEKVQLGLPELWMADEPVAVETKPDAMVIELPFGFGKMPLHRCDKDLCGTVEPVAGKKMEMRLSRAKKPEGQQHAASFKSGDAIIQGSLWLPEGIGPHPVVVLVHGSGGNTRENWSYRGPAAQFLRSGVAVLLYDKRGFGASDGPWKQASYPDLEQLGQNLSDAIEWLAQQKDIDKKRIGVFGGSQATWTTALASERTNKIAFAILTGAPAVTPQQQEWQRVHTMFDHPSWSDAARHSAYSHLDLYFEAVHNAKKEGDVFAASLKAENTDWGSDVPTAKTSDDFYWWRRNADYDPASTIKRWKFSVLLMYGENDQIVPSKLNLPLWREYLKDADMEEWVFAGGDHRIELRGGTNAEGQWKFPRMAIGMPERIDQFICQRILSDVQRTTRCQ